jgi:hypothetical protein
MKSKIILPIAISTLLLAFYASAQIPATPIEQQILPILKWIVAKTPEGWYGYLQDLVDANNLVTNLKIEQNIKNGDDLYLSFRPLSLVSSPAFRYVLREGITGQAIRSVSVEELNKGSLKFTVPTLNLQGKKYPFVYFVVYEEPNIVRESGTSTSLEKPEKRGNPLVVTHPLIYSYSKPVQIISPQPGSTLKSGYATYIKWESNLPKDYLVYIDYTVRPLCIRGVGSPAFPPCPEPTKYPVARNIKNTGYFIWNAPSLAIGKEALYGFLLNTPSYPDENLYMEGNNLLTLTAFSPTSSATYSDSVKILKMATTSFSPYIKVLSPNGGEKIEIGSTYTIKWEKRGNILPSYGLKIFLLNQDDGCYGEITNLGRFYDKNQYDWKVDLNKINWVCPTKGYKQDKTLTLLQSLVDKKLLSASILKAFAAGFTHNDTDKYVLAIVAVEDKDNFIEIYASDRSDSPFNIVQPTPKPTIQILRKEANAPEPLLYGGTTTQLARFEFVNSGFQEDNPMNFNLQFVQYNYTYYYDEKYPIKSQMLKDVKVVVDGDINGYSTTSDWSINIPITIPAGRINGTHTIEFIATTRDYQDELYPYNYYHLILGFNNVVPQISDYKKSGSDSKRFKIHLPYYPSTNSSATVGAEEYPAIVLYPDTSTKQVSVFFTSFTGRFDTIHVGLEGPNGQRKEIIKNCDGTCPRDINTLIEKFGHPSEWGFLVLKWDFNKTIQYTGKLTMDRCVGTLNFDAKNLKPTIMICSNRMAFGNNYGWGRNMKLRINWNYIPYFAPGKEALNYLFILPRDINQHFPPAPRKAY